MANTKISELPSATTPLGGTELAEIVQGGVNKKVAVSELGGGGSQNLAEVLAIGGRTIKPINVNSYEFVATDKSEYLLINGNVDDVVLTLDDSLFDNGDTIIGVGGVEGFTITIDNADGFINPTDTASFNINFLDEFKITKISVNAWILTITNYASNQSGGGASWGAITGTLSAQTDLQTELDGKQNKLVVVSSNTTASNDTNYNVVANATFTDPTPVEGKGYVVFVRNGTATIGGVGYAVGRIIYRVYHSGAWSSTIYVDQVYVDAKVADAINDGTTTIAPSQNAVFDALALKANLASPTFTGTPSAPTPSANDNSTKIATTAYVDGKKVRIFLTADASNNTVADTDITTFTFTLPASGQCDFRVCLPFTSAAVSTGINTTVKITTGVGANGNLLGNVFTKTRLSVTTTSPVINIVDQGANATVGYSALSGVSTAGLTNVVEINCDLTNLATNTSATIVIAFASEVGGSNIDVKRGASMVIDL